MDSQHKPGPVACLLVVILAAACSQKEKQLVPIEDYSRFCVLWASCEQVWSWQIAVPGPVFEDEMRETLGLCIAHYDGMDAKGVHFVDSDQMRCMLEAGGDCDASFRCINEGHPPEACDLSDYDNHCDGQTLVHCHNGMVWHNDCAYLDQIYSSPYDFTCRESSPSSAGCMPPSCSGFSTRCRGPYLERCTDGYINFIDCRWYAGTGICGTIDGEAMCVGTGDPCDEASFEERCEGTAAVYCLGEREAMEECAPHGDYVCEVSIYDHAWCAGAGSECDLSEYVDACNGTSVTFCHSGHVRSLDCTSLGFSTCAEVNGRARCI